MPQDLDSALAFRPLYKERVWGGRRLAELFGRDLPGDAPIGESWELVDREDEQSVVADGPLAGTTLHELWTEHREDVFGRAGAASSAERFPLLLKLLDARETLSLQVHPPAGVAGELGGEPKSEAWLILDADDDACLYAGLRGSVGREDFERTVRDGGDVAALLHHLAVAPGDALVVPAGRVHAIGAGCVIAEVQQSSDTTYRVDDFRRLGLDGKPRELHVEQSLRCIDFDDVEPASTSTPGVIADWEHFGFDAVTLGGDPVPVAADGEAAVVVVAHGEVVYGEARFGAGDVFLLPASTPVPSISGAGAVGVVRLPGAAAP